MLGQANPPMPPGYTLLTSVTPAEQRWAYGIVHDPTTTYGDLFEATFNGVPIVAHVEHHTWTTDAAGNHIPGAYKGVTLYRPTGSMAPMSTSNGMRIVEAVIFGSAIFGTVFTVSKSYFEHQNARRAYEAPIREKVREKLMKGAKANPAGGLEWYKVDFGWEAVGSGPYGSKSIYAIEDLGRRGVRLQIMTPSGAFKDYGVLPSFDAASKRSNDIEATVASVLGANARRAYEGPIREKVREKLMKGAKANPRKYAIHTYSKGDRVRLRWTRVINGETIAAGTVGTVTRVWNGVDTIYAYGPRGRANFMTVRFDGESYDRKIQPGYVEPV